MTDRETIVRTALWSELGIGFYPDNGTWRATDDRLEALYRAAYEAGAAAERERIKQEQQRCYADRGQS